MKKLIILLLIGISIDLFGQNVIDPPNLFTLTNDSLQQDIGLLNRGKQSKFLIGWNWASPGVKLDDALNINTYHDYPFSGECGDSMNAILSFHTILCSRQTNLPFTALSLYLNPTITVDSSKNFKPKPYDNTGAIFGFCNKNKVWILDSSQHTNSEYPYAILSKDSVPYGTSTLVLSNIWKKDALHFLNYDKTHWDSLSGLNGSRFYLTINLKSNEAIPDSLRDSVILSIKLPYTFHHEGSADTYDSVIFFCFPQYTGNIFYDLGSIVGSFGDFRGIHRNTPIPLNGENTKVWNIRGKDLMTDAVGTGNTLITLSAFIKFDAQLGSNPRLFPDWYQHPLITEYITKLDMEVRYHGHLNTSVQFFRFETPQAQQVFRGQLDFLVDNNVHSVLNTFRTLPDHPRMFRFYAEDEFIPMQYGSNRYFNMLVDTLATTELGLYLNSPVHYLYATGIKEFWNGSNANFDNCAVPFIKQTKCAPLDSTYKTFGYLAGYNGSINHEKTYHSINYQDTLKSDYETKVYSLRDSSSFLIPIFFNTSNYYNGISDTITHFSTQYTFEKSLYLNYYQNPDLIYGKNNWWANLWLLNCVDYKTTNERNILLTWNRLYTGEQTRAVLWQCINLGTKGFLFYIKQNTPYSRFDSTYINGDTIQNYIKEMGFNVTSTQTYQNSLLTGRDLIYDDLTGPDFIDLKDETLYDWKHYLNSRNYNWSVMGVDSNRFYNGVKSARAEVWKMTNFIKANEATLLKLRLAAWYGKGHIQLYSQDTARFSDTLLKKFISLNPDSLYSKRIWNPEEDTIQTLKEAWDSSFFDITLLRNDGDETMIDEVVVAIQNRRTDTLIYTKDTVFYKIYDEEGGYVDRSFVNTSMKFYTTAEMDDYVQNGGDLYFVPPDTTIGNDTYVYQRYRETSYWRDLYWKRLGCRSIRVPFNVRRGSLINDQFTLVHVTELGYDDTTLNKQFWFKKPYNHLIDTIVNRDSAIVVNLLPGQGKLLSCRFLRSNNQSGELAFSNQRKMVAYPDNQIASTGVPNTSKVRYHAAYFKEIPDGSGRLGVYYRRSLPMEKVVQNEQIQWELVDYLISDSIIVNSNGEPERKVKSRSCAYPSIVVRYDSVSANPKIRVYIVYACENELSTANQQLIYIIENKFTGMSDFNSDSLKYGREIALSHGDEEKNIHRWGTPMINASYNGNYYTWSDSLYGIAAAYKDAGTNNFRSNHSIFLKWYGNETSPKTLHPSLNTYSRLFSGEKDCAIVWQEREGNTNENSYDILYTRLKIDLNDNLVNYINAPRCNPSNSFFGEFNSNNNIVKIRDSILPPNYYNKYWYPVVYRGIELGEACCYATDACHNDRIFWQGTDELNTNVIWIAGVQLLDDYNSQTGEWEPFCIDIPGLSSIRSISETGRNSLYLPDAAQGCMSKITVNDFDNKGDSIIVTNFVLMPEEDPPSVTNGKIWQVWSSYFGFFNDWQTLRDNFINYEYARPISGYGTFPHLAALPAIVDDTTWIRNRRIFEAMDGNNKEIVTSLEWFYRETDENEKQNSVPFFGYVGDSCKTMFSHAYLIDNSGSVSRPYIKTFDLNERFRQTRDTIISDWFTASSVKKLQLYGYGYGESLLKVQIQRARDGRNYQLNTPVQENKVVKQRYQLFNGGENKFRLIFTKESGNRSYKEELLIGGLPNLKDFRDVIDNDRFGRYVEESQEQIIDLGDGRDDRDDSGKNIISISIYPNPADELVYTTAYMPYTDVGKYNKMTIKVFSNLGLELYRQDVKSGETITINTKNYPQGAYFIRAEEQSDRFFTEKQSPAVQGFVIRR